MKFTVALAVHFAAAVAAITTAPVTSETPVPITSPGFPPCHVCDAGMVVTIPDTILDLFGDPMSCEEWQLAGLAGSVDPNDCQYLRFFTTQADVCGCAMDSFAPATSRVLAPSAPVKSVNPPGPSFPVISTYPVSEGNPICQVCDDGMIMTIPEAILVRFGFPTSCSEWQVDGLLGFVNRNDCQYVRSQANVCGCAIDNTVCTLCENGGDDFIPGRLKFLSREKFLFESKTCADIAVSMKGNRFLNSADGFKKCQITQATIGEYCGCSNPIARSKLFFPLCGKNTPLPDPTRLVGSGRPCASVESDKNQSPLGRYDEYEQEYCCAAQPYTCLFTPCENGASPLYPDAEVGLFGLTCGDVQGFIQDTALLQGNANCELFRTPGLQKCGCPPCTLCEDGTDSFDPSHQPKKYSSDGISSSLGFTCAQEAVNHATDTPAYCSFAQATIGEQCGCNNPIARANFECQLCGPGKSLPDPTRMVDRWTSCADKEFQYAAELCYYFGPGASCCNYEVDFCCAVTVETRVPAPFKTPGPVSSYPPRTSAPVTSPGYPPCQVCGAGKVVTIPDGTVSLPGRDPLSCKALQIQGLTGYVEQKDCPIVNVFTSKCGCAPTTVKKYPKGFCFSGETTVAVKHKGSMLMKHLQIGDEVLTTSGNYEHVYSFGHRLEAIEAEFLQLLPSGLEISRDHMVLVKGRFVPASLVQVGDMLESASGNFVTVDSIESVIRNGVYAPFTKSGTIVVSNIKASTYVAFQDTDRLHIGSWASPLTFQWVARVSQSPHRLCTRLGWTGAEQYTVDGKSLWIAGPLDFAEWLLEQNGMIMGAVLVPTLGLGLMSMALEGLVSWFDSSSK